MNENVPENYFKVVVQKPEIYIFTLGQRQNTEKCSHSDLRQANCQVNSNISSDMK